MFPDNPQLGQTHIDGSDIYEFDATSWVNLRLKAENQRKAAYQQEADPLFFSYQRGEATEQEWLDAVQSVKDRYPYPEAP